MDLQNSFFVVSVIFVATWASGKDRGGRLPLRLSDISGFMVQVELATEITRKHKVGKHGPSKLVLCGLCVLCGYLGKWKG
jgi:hypothetical protein